MYENNDLSSIKKDVNKLLSDDQIRWSRSKNLIEKITFGLKNFPKDELESHVENEVN